MNVLPQSAHNGIGSTHDVSTSDAHDLLSVARRRATLRVVVHHGEIDKSALFDAVAAREYGDPTDRERKRVQVSLSQVHLPKLADADVVAVDGDTVTTGPQAGRVLSFDHDTRSGGLLGRVASAFR